jgi:hypothetical protein
MRPVPPIVAISVLAVFGAANAMMTGLFDGGYQRVRYYLDQTPVLAVTGSDAPVAVSRFVDTDQRSGGGSDASGPSRSATVAGGSFLILSAVETVPDAVGPSDSGAVWDPAYWAAPGGIGGQVADSAGDVSVVASIPEPTSLMLLGVAGVGLLAARSRRRK